MLECSACGEEKELSLFPHRNGRRYGLRCKACLAAQERRRRSENPDYRERQILSCRRYMLKRNYGLTLEEYECIVAEQDGGCAVCGRKNFAGRYLAVDHDHETGLVRGALCDNCNRAIGLFEDRAELLDRAATYLRGGN